MKQLILTVDYELFFGDDAGTVENCMIRPVKRLMEVLDVYGGQMTVFWDILHFYRLKQLEGEVPDLRFDRELIEKQIQQLLIRGHDVQMHIHPHWLDARWENKKWRFTYNRFSLHRLWDEGDTENVETIMGCITQSRLLMEEVCRVAQPDYKVRVFRAGGYRVEPFERLADALRSNNIKVDASAAFGMKSYEPQFPFDFSRLPSYLHYRFDTSVLRHTLEGYFWEFPKETIKVPGHVRFFFYFLQNFVFVGNGSFGDGKRLHFTRREQSGHWWSQIGSRYYRLTPEGMDPIRWHYLVKKARQNGQTVLHSKSMSPFTIRMLDASMKNKEVAFKSLLQRIKQLPVYDDEFS
jgi:hypothetical protein